MNIIIDTKGQADLLVKNSLHDSDDDAPDDDDDDYELDFDPKQFDTIIGTNYDAAGAGAAGSSSSKCKRISSNKDIDLEEFEIEMGWKNVGDEKKNKTKKKQPTIAATTTSTNLDKITKELTPLDKLLEKSVIKPGFERLESLPAYDVSQKKLREQRRREREKTKGKKWFDLPAPEMTDEVRHDLEVLQMRSVLDPKHFYKKNDLKVLPKYFQIGKVMDSPLDYYNNRLTKKERKKTIVDELMADAEFSKFNKRKYKEIIDEKRKSHFKSHRHAKKLKGKKK